MSAKAWALEIDRDWAEQFESLHDAVAHVAFEAVRRVDDRSPVDTGRFRANWTLSIGGPSAEVTQAADPAGSATVAENAARLAAYPDDSFPVIYLQNNLPYAERLEDGYSRQAPGGMVGLTVLELAAMWEATQL